MSTHRLQALAAIVLAAVVALAAGLALNRPAPPAVKEIASLAAVLRTNEPVLSVPAQLSKFNRLTANLEARARNDPSAPYWQTWAWLNELTLFVRSPHTFIYFWQASPNIYPVAFYWTSTGLAVSAWPQQGDLFPEFSQVVTLAGMSPARLLVRLQAVTAGNSYWVRRFGSIELPFPYLLHWIGAIGSSGTLHLTVREPDGQVKSVIIRPLSGPLTRSRVTALNAWAIAHMRFPVDQAYSWYIDARHRYGVFRIPMMAWNTTLQTDLRAFFVAVEKDGLHRLLFDVRDDPGGNSCVMNAVAVYLPGGASTIGQCGTAPPPTAGLLFSGRVYVAQGWGSFSSAAQFPAALSQLPEVTVIGAPTGGSPSGDFGDIVMFKIAAPSKSLVGQVGTTQICFLSYLFRSAPASASPPPVPNGCPLIPTFEPEVPIPFTLQDLRAHVDPVIQWMNAQP